MKVRIIVNAKINLSLSILSKESSGYHCLDSVTASVNIYDAVSVCPSKTDTRVRVKGKDIAEIDPENNSAMRAAKLFSEQFWCGSYNITVKKGIPLCAGMGGSSADAAAVLHGLCRLNSVDVKAAKVQAAALTLGSDVPYMLRGGYARVLGLGQTVQPLSIKNTLHLVIAAGGGGVSTAECYKKFDEQNPTFVSKKYDYAALVLALKTGDLQALSGIMHNALYEPACALNPEIPATMDALKQSGAICALMTGSGSACYGIYPTETAARTAAKQLSKKMRFACYARTVDKGCITRGAGAQ